MNPKFILFFVIAIIIFIIVSYNSNSGTVFLEIRNDKISDWIIANEKVRVRFLLKRKKFLMGQRLPGEIGLWDGAVTIWSYFPPTFTCPTVIERIGTPGDGGKWTCGFTTMESSRKECIVYSFGISTESTFEMEILERTSCKIFAYDHTVSGVNLHGRENSPELKSRLKFSKFGLGSEDNSTEGIFTLGHFMRQNTHGWIDFLKIDIEAAEFPALQQITKEFKDKLPFGHLNVEVHLNEGENEQAEFKRFYDTFVSLEDGGLRPFSWEVNHGPGVNRMKPVLMEYSFINIKDSRNTLLQF